MLHLWNICTYPFVEEKINYLNSGQQICFNETLLFGGKLYVVNLYDINQLQSY